MARTVPEHVKRACLVAIGTLFLVCSPMASAYEVRPGSVSGPLGKDPIHESLTVASLHCAARATGQRTEEVTCDPSYRDLRTLWERYSANALFKGAAAEQAEQLVRGVRWPDDPLRNLEEVWTSAKWAQVFLSCDALMLPNEGSCANRLCQSHFGNLQIWHAMKPARPWCDRSSDFGCSAPLDDRSVLADILAWADFLSGIATGGVSLDAPLLTHAGTWFDGSCKDVYPADIKVRDLLRTDCTSETNSVQITYCDLRDIPDAELRWLALGALLHLVQDSYARAHVRRAGLNDDCPAPTIACGRPLAFYDYATQDSVRHSDSDQWPTWSSNCDTAEESAEPIAAGATLIRLARSGKRSEMAAYLRERVLLDLPMGERPEGEACYKPGATAQAILRPAIVQPGGDAGCSSCGMSASQGSGSAIGVLALLLGALIRRRSVRGPSSTQTIAPQRETLRWTGPAESRHDSPSRRGRDIGTLQQDPW